MAVDERHSTPASARPRFAASALDVARKDGRGRRAAPPRARADAARRTGPPRRPRPASRSCARPAARRADPAARPSRRHHRLQQDRRDPQDLDRHVEHDAHARRIALGELPGLRIGEIAVRLRDDLEHGARDRDAARISAYAGALRRRARRRAPASPDPRSNRRRLAPVGTRAAAVPGDHRQRALRQIAEVVGEVGVHARDDRLVRIAAVLAERHLAQEEIAHRIEAISGDQARRDRRRCRPTSTSSRRG